MELAFDGLTCSEYWTPVPCAYNVETEEKVTLAELISILNNWERQLAFTASDAHVQHIRQTLYAVGIDWNKATAQLANCPWVTEDYIHAHVTAVPSHHLGLAIQRMLDGLPPPLSRRERQQRQALKRYPQIRR
ncbi:MAG: hypothetical protein H6657_24700 [Ardenticatenaceae bacterium]|nr:hypothetical protein [Ardenticatenaceae bacterium]